MLYNDWTLLILPISPNISQYISRYSHNLPESLPGSAVGSLVFGWPMLCLPSLCCPKVSGTGADGHGFCASHAQKKLEAKSARHCKAL